MTLQDLGSLGEFVAAFATLATLVYLAAQTRQGRRSASAQAPQWISDGCRSWISAPREDPELGDLVIRALQNWSELSPVDQLKVHCWWAEKVVHLDAVLTLHEQGVIDDERKAAWVDGSLALLVTPGGRQWWSDTKSLFTPQVRCELERRLQDESSLPAGWTTTLPFFRHDVARW